MTSLEIISFRETLKNFINKQEMPKIIISMILKELHEEVEKETLEEIMAQAKEIEDGKS